MLQTNHYIYVISTLKQTNNSQVSILDDGVGRVVKALSDKKLLDNTIILFFADNGAPIEIEHRNAGSNIPLRGVSYTGPFLTLFRSLMANSFTIYCIAFVIFAAIGIEL